MFKLHSVEPSFEGKGEGKSCYHVFKCNLLNLKKDNIYALHPTIIISFNSESSPLCVSGGQCEEDHCAGCDEEASAAQKCHGVHRQRQTD